MTRSNRQLTQFAVNKVKEYLTKGPTSFDAEKAGNTRVSFSVCNTCPRSTIKICLFDKLIMELVINPLKPTRVAGMVIKTGDFYDSKGRPSRTTRERLNGLLDALGEQNLFPEGVRVFFKEDGSCCLGKGDNSMPFDSSHSSHSILAHPRDVVFA